MPKASSNVDLFSEAALTDPYAQYAELRAAVWLERLNLWALPRYQQVRQTVLDWATFSSKDAISVDDAHGQYFSGTVSSVDPPDHDRLRAIIMPSLSRRSLQSIKGSIEQLAREFVDPLLETSEFDAIAQMAAPFPVKVVCDNAITCRIFLDVRQSLTG
jgi:cytochrome P450